MSDCCVVSRSKVWRRWSPLFPSPSQLPSLTIVSRHSHPPSPSDPPPPTLPFPPSPSSPLPPLPPPSLPSYGHLNCPLSQSPYPSVLSLPPPPSAIPRGRQVAYAIHVQCQHSGVEVVEEWTTTRQFSDFHDLHMTLRNTVSHVISHDLHVISHHISEHPLATYVYSCLCNSTVHHMTST